MRKILHSTEAWNGFKRLILMLQKNRMSYHYNIGNINGLES